MERFYETKSTEFFRNVTNYLTIINLVNIEEAFLPSHILKEKNSGRGHSRSGRVSNTTPLHMAIQGGHIDIVKYLLQQGANREARDKENRTPMHCAAQFGQLDIIKTLILNGCNQEARGGEGNWTALHFAELHQQSNVVEFLSPKG
jgi:hypothetical protein